VTGSALLSQGALLVLAPALPGVAAKTKAWLTGRRGAPVLQLYWDLGRLWGKGVVYSTTTTWMFRLAPVVGVVTPLLAGFLLPLNGDAAVLGFAGDFVAFAGLLALGRFALVLAALDTGSSFEGMGASRETTFASLVEPALFISFVVLALATGQQSLSGMLGAGGGPGSSWRTAAPSLAMVAVSLFFVLLAEASRVPVDDPATHLELTMIHEVAVLDHSGPDLALLLYGGALRMALFAALLIGVLMPRTELSAPLTLAALVGGSVLVAVAVGVVESSMARLRLSRVPQFLVAASVLASLGAILQLLG
jgi:formate hydrogenlyase subunit 4